MDQIPLVIVADVEDAECALPYVDGTIGGRPYRFLLDTGAARSQVVGDELLLGFAQERTHTSRGAFGGLREARLAEVPDVAIGPLKVGSLLATLTGADEPGAQNLIGMDVLRSHSCDLRFSSAELVVDAGTTTGSWLPLHLDDVGHPYVQLDWRDVSAQAVWDTGAGITVVDEAFYRRWPALFRPGGTSVGTDARGEQVSAELAMVDGPSLGGADLRPHKVAVVDLSAVNATLERPMDFILGYPTLRQADWRFDFPARRWSLSVHADAP